MLFPAVLGTGSALDFGPQTSIGIYNIVALLLLQAVQSNRRVLLQITITSAPTASNVTGGVVTALVALGFLLS